MRLLRSKKEPNTLNVVLEGFNESSSDSFHFHCNHIPKHDRVVDAVSKTLALTAIVVDDDQQEPKIISFPDVGLLIASPEQGEKSPIAPQRRSSFDYRTSFDTTDSMSMSTTSPPPPPTSTTTPPPPPTTTTITGNKMGTFPERVEFPECFQQQQQHHQQRPPSVNPKRGSWTRHSQSSSSQEQSRLSVTSLSSLPSLSSIMEHDPDFLSGYILGEHDGSSVVSGDDSSNSQYTSNDSVISSCSSSVLSGSVVRFTNDNHNHTNHNHTNNINNIPNNIPNNINHHRSNNNIRSPQPLEKFEGKTLDCLDSVVLLSPSRKEPQQRWESEERSSTTSSPTTTTTTTSGSTSSGTAASGSSSNRGSLVDRKPNVAQRRGSLLVSHSHLLFSPGAGATTKDTMPKMTQRRTSSSNTALL
jgi:hypothetical protein